jgi:subtilisin family serine protease
VTDPGQYGRAVHTASRERRPGRLLLATAAVSLLTLGWGTVTDAGAHGTAGGTAAIDSLEELRRLAAATEDLSGERVAVLADANGASPGGLAVTTVQAPDGDGAALAAELDGVDGVLSAEVDSRVELAADPLSGFQYASERTRADQVASSATGDGLLVAVIDSGVKASHEDLSPQLPGGRTRVLSGTTFLSPDQPGAPDPTGDPANIDPNGHGTHVAGIIAAAQDNAKGIAGLAPDAQILPVRVLDASGFGWSSDVAAGLLYAHQQGADVINLSLAGPSWSSTVADVVAQISADSSRGKPPPVLVAAAGNSGTNYSKMYPAALSNVIAVASSNERDNVAATSSRGTYVDLAAPGVDIVSTDARPQCNGYCTRSGTSMASPFVAAAVALLLEREPTLTPSQVGTRLAASAFDIDVLGKDTASGQGRVDVAGLLDPDTYPRVVRPPYAPSGSLSSVDVRGTRLTVRGRASDRDGAPTVRITSVVAGRRSVRTITSSDGSFSFSWNDLRGTHRVCAEVLDSPTGTAAAIGCRDAVVK